MLSTVQDSDVDIPETIRKLKQAFYNNHNYIEASEHWIAVFGVPGIFARIEEAVPNARDLICPHCGLKGLLMAKTTVSKKKYRYTKLYVYHEIEDASMISSRKQKWCYLNKQDRKNSPVREAIQRTIHALNVREYFYRSLILR